MLQVTNISKKYSEVEVLKNISFDLQLNKTLSVLGKSGGGKTTLLKIIAGLSRQDSGEIVFDNINISNQEPELRKVVYLYQEPLLFPHLTVRGNLEFPLRLNKTISKEEVRRKAEEMAEELGIADQLDKHTGQLSGGQKQRVNFGRALLASPRLLLLDEPFGNLDAQTRSEMQTFYKKIAVEHQITSIFVTHDLKEALLMGDRYGLLKKGALKEYSSVSEMQEDSVTGLQNEINFWKELESK
ncbi:ATP-binding cassette domain-containing protein [Mangrovivirga cuniculi]|uniref:Sulfate ABC transporter ATP-binding protein n=1 Tax=Mangrovivirga cuniculi TaxID=2715131 RepID=A0A4D7JY69_9BACT|nr:ATP-binding cassette domain-containing protein [Mangrovivirga cuniculi]QCK17126.1 sulfate ABC transporter ATP-binding protein [Mangrovivirga cuniculi]